MKPIDLKKKSYWISAENGSGYTTINELRPFHIENAVIGYDQLTKERDES